MALCQVYRKNDCVLKTGILGLTLLYVGRKKTGWIRGEMINVELCMDENQ